jgi:hypothetical protein
MPRGGARPGAGRPSERLKIEDRARLSVSTLQRERRLIPGSSGYLPWEGSGQRPQESEYSASGNELEIRYLFGGRFLRLSLSIERTPCAFGGTRPWLLCPSCRRRTGHLYLHYSGVDCRGCARLGYASQFASALRRATEA